MSARYLKYIIYLPIWKNMTSPPTRARSATTSNSLWSSAWILSKTAGFRTSTMWKSKELVKRLTPFVAPGDAALMERHLYIDSRVKAINEGRLHQRRLVPCCTITTQQDQIIRVLLGQFLEKYVHTSRIAIRHNKKTGASRYWFNSSVCIPILTNVVARYRWTNALFTPAVFGLIDSSESCFILEHKSYFLMWMTRLVYIIL